MSKKKVNIPESEMLARLVAQGMSEKKAKDIVILNLQGIQSAPAAFFVICTGNAPAHTEAIADSIHETVKKITKSNPYKTEGYENAEWILMDYFDVIAHVFLEKNREFYKLEQLWADGERIEFQE